MEKTTTPTNQESGFTKFAEVPAELLKAQLIESFDSLDNLHGMKDTAFQSLFTFITTIRTDDNTRTGEAAISENQICDVVYPLGRWYDFLSKISRFKAQ